MGSKRKRMQRLYASRLKPTQIAEDRDYYLEEDILPLKSSTKRCGISGSERAMR